jgi:MraZ protein
MFIGEYTNKIDDKGRLAIPSKFRADLSGGAVVTKGLDGCLFVYSRNEWQKFADQLTTLPITNADNRAFVRQMFAGAFDAQIDSQGRVNLPIALRQFANLKTSVVVAGLSNHIEIWDESVWRGYQAKTESAVEEIAERIVF